MSGYLLSRLFDRIRRRAPSSKQLAEQDSAILSDDIDALILTTSRRNDEHLDSGVK